MFKQLFATFVLMLLALPLSAQVKVTGRVTDENNSPLPGASIVVKGTTHGVSSDFDGNYEIQAKQGDVLEVSFIGFQTQSKKVTGSGKQVINVILKEDAQQLEDVVVVGFGTQKKENLTGSVTSVDTKVLEARPVTSAVQALQGAVPGMNFSVGNTGGELNSNLNINIRGGGTIGKGSKASPLVLIDGMEGDLNTLNPQDIESISVLKDAASSSIYGSRAPFGVILVTTKSGREGRIQINYNNSFRFSSAMNTPRMLDSESFAYYWNDASANSGGNPIFRPEIIEKIKQYKAGELTVATDWNERQNKWNEYMNAWDNVDWFKQFYRNWAPAQEHNLSIRGGNEKTNYYLSLGWLDQEGLVRYNTDMFDRYSLNGKISSQILPYLRVNYNARFIRTDYTRSSYLTEGNGLFFHNIARRWPTLPVYDPNGNFLYGNEIAHLNNGKITDQKDILTQQLAFVFTPIKGWTTNVELNYRVQNNWTHSYWLPIYKYDRDGNPEVVSLQLGGLDKAGSTKVREYAYRYNFFNPNIYTSYEQTIGDHYFKGLVGFQSELARTRNVSADRDGLYSTSVIGINAAGGANDNVSGDNQHWATAGFFGRLNYDYKGKYLLEGNIRYDGTSRFLKDQRWNTFTSASIGWNVAKESFWEHLGKFGEAVSEFKFKASYGELGNQNTDNWYPFYPKMKLKTDDGRWLLNRQRTNTASAPDLISTFLTWEKVASWNVGFDLSALQNRLALTFEVFQRNTHNMVGPAPQLPSALGTAPPRINNTDMESRGFDFQISWRDRIGDDFSYGISANLTDSRQRVTKYPNDTKNLNDWYDGRYSGEIWGYVTRGIAKTDQEMNDWLANHNQDQLGSNWTAGDIMYEDLNGDGKINQGANTLSDSGDIKIIGNSTPRYNYGVNIDMKYKGIDFSIFLQGTGKRDLDLRSVYFRGANTGMWQAAGFVEHLDYFRPEGTNSPLGANTDAYYPRPLFSGSDKNFQAQTRWLQNGAYLRIKNIQLGYTFPTDIMQKIGVDKLRIYVSAENVATFTKLSRIFDPEVISGGRWGDGEYGKIYPLSRVISTGLTLTF
ncbi:MAG: TonB-dependent receptor [Capnocytophaga felis]|nr:TonB-dependent receptor [Capnocytophaga felis]